MALRYPKRAALSENECGAILGKNESRDVTQGELCKAGVDKLNQPYKTLFQAVTGWLSQSSNVERCQVTNEHRELAQGTLGVNPKPCEAGVDTLNRPYETLFEAVTDWLSQSSNVERCQVTNEHRELAQGTLGVNPKLCKAGVDTLNKPYETLFEAVTGWLSQSSNVERFQVTNEHRDVTQR